MSYVKKINTKYEDVASNISYELPALITENGIIISHLRYLAWFNTKSTSWRERAIFSLKLLIEYINSVQKIDKGYELLKAFRDSLVTGTIDYDNCNDPSGLFWKPRSIHDINNILHHLNHYTDFLAIQDEYTTIRVNPFRKATSYEERLNWCAYYNKQKNVFLNHLSNKDDAKKQAQRQRLISRISSIKVDNDKVVRFPEEHIEELIYEGFNRKGVPDYKCQAMTILLNAGGVRKSELFHIYTSDITLHPTRPDEALVRIYHPEHGHSPDPRYKNRMEYLSAETNYHPRNQYSRTKRLHAGWKGALLTDNRNFFEVIFSPAHKAKEFLYAWTNYLKYQRVEPTQFNRHPFAFTNSKGKPETVKNFQRLHKNAVEKIGLECKKELGTTEHGHRHAYGYRIRKYGLEPIEIQKSMHQKSPNSCLVYIKPSNEELREHLNKTEIAYNSKNRIRDIKTKPPP